MKKDESKSEFPQNNSIPKKRVMIVIVDQIEFTDKKEIAKKFNSYFVSIETSLASKIPSLDLIFMPYLPTFLTTLVI